MTDAGQAVRRQAEALMETLGVQHLGQPLQARGWTFGFDRARVRLGRCVFRRGRTPVRTITLGAAHAAEGWTADVEDTVRHEIAHALDYETRGRSGHDAVWRRLARSCGAMPRACAVGPRRDDSASPYVGRCASCGHSHAFYRAPLRTYRCPACRADVLVVADRRTGAPVQGRAAYLGRCPACGQAQAFARKPRRRYACTPCCRTHAHGRFDARFALRVTRATAG